MEKLIKSYYIEFKKRLKTKYFHFYKFIINIIYSEAAVKFFNSFLNKI